MSLEKITRIFMVASWLIRGIITGEMRCRPKKSSSKIIVETVLLRVYILA